MSNVIDLQEVKKHYNKTSGYVEIHIPVIIYYSDIDETKFKCYKSCDNPELDRNHILQVAVKNGAINFSCADDEERAALDELLQEIYKKFNIGVAGDVVPFKAKENGKE